MQNKENPRNFWTQCHLLKENIDDCLCTSLPATEWAWSLWAKQCKQRNILMLLEVSRVTIMKNCHSKKRKSAYLCSSTSHKCAHLAKADCSGALKRFLKGEIKVENADSRSFTGELKHAGPTCSALPYEPAAPPFRAGDAATAFCVKNKAPDISPAKSRVSLFSLMNKKLQARLTFLSCILTDSSCSTQCTNERQEDVLESLFMNQWITLTNLTNPSVLLQLVKCWEWTPAWISSIQGSS